MSFNHYTFSNPQLQGLYILCMVLYLTEVDRALLGGIINAGTDDPAARFSDAANRDTVQSYRSEADI